MDAAWELPRLVIADRSVINPTVGLASLLTDESCDAVVGQSPPIPAQAML